MKISRALVQRNLISYSCSWTCFPGRFPRTNGIEVVSLSAAGRTVMRALGRLMSAQQLQSYTLSVDGPHAPVERPESTDIWPASASRVRCFCAPPVCALALRRICTGLKTYRMAQGRARAPWSCTAIITAGDRPNALRRSCPSDGEKILLRTDLRVACR